MTGKTFSLLGMLGAFLAVIGGVVGCTAGMSGKPTVAIIGLILLIIGGGMGAKYK